MYNTREPHLPVEPGVEGLDEAWTPVRVAGLPPELIRRPLDAVTAPFHHDLRPLGRHHPEQPVAVHRAERRERVEQTLRRSQARTAGAAPAGRVYAASRTALAVESTKRTAPATPTDTRRNEDSGVSPDRAGGGTAGRRRDRREAGRRARSRAG